MDATFLEKVGADVLAVCEDAYGQVPDAPTIPGRRFVTHGQPVWDNEQLAVAVLAIKPTKPFPQQQISRIECAVIAGVDLSIEIVRKWCTNGCDADQLAAATMLLGRDAATLWAHVAQEATGGRLLRSFPGVGCKAVGLGGLVPVGPQGGMAGWRWPISIELAIP